MKKSRNFITLFLAICTFFVTQALAAEQEVDKTPSVQAQTDEKPADDHRTESNKRKNRHGAG